MHIYIYIQTKEKIINTIKLVLSIYPFKVSIPEMLQDK